MSQLSSEEKTQAPKKLTSSDIAHLDVRRHKHHDEVAPEVGDQWADRLPPNPILIQPTEPENRLFDEFTSTWTHPGEDAAAPSSGLRVIALCSLPASPSAGFTRSDGHGRERVED